VDDRYIVALIMKHPNSHQVSGKIVRKKRKIVKEMQLILFISQSLNFFLQLRELYGLGHENFI